LDPRIHRRNLYARCKAESERLLMDLHRNRGLPVVIFRPGVVLGVGGSPFHWGVGFWPAESICRLWGNGASPLPLVLVDDVACAMARVVEIEGIEGMSFNLVSDPCLDARTYVAELGKVLEMRIDVSPMPAWRSYMAELGKWLVKGLIRHPGRRLPSYRDWQTRSHQARFDCSLARRVLGWNSVVERERMLEEGVRRPAAAWVA
jgi:nucleoside-diphosphate-sugar epimerase